MKVTGTPARPGPDTAQNTTSPVTGFVLTGPDVPTTYISGDNASLVVVEQVAERPLHTEGCAHITEGPGTLPGAFASHGLARQLTLLAPGEQATV